jgi:hypothetical protein
MILTKLALEQKVFKTYIFTYAKFIEQLLVGTPEAVPLCIFWNFKMSGFSSLLKKQWIQNKKNNYDNMHQNLLQCI